MTSLTSPAAPPSSPATSPALSWAIFLDFDGTLVDIAARPDDVVVEAGLPGLLQALRAGQGGALAIVTGRPIVDIDGFLPGLELDVCGHHGLERRVAGRVHRPDLPDLASEVTALRARLAPHPGILVEDKGIGVAVHWRLAPAAEGHARAAVADLVGRLGSGYRVQDGKAVSEIVPAAAGKGRGIRAIMAEPPYAGRRPFFAGDDRTDEHGFAAVRDLGGLTVKIGAGPTEAERRLGSPAALRGWLASWMRDMDAPASLHRAEPSCDHVTGA